MWSEQFASEVFNAQTPPYDADKLDQLINEVLGNGISIPHSGMFVCKHH